MLMLPPAEILSWERRQGVNKARAQKFSEVRACPPVINLDGHDSDGISRSLPLCVCETHTLTAMSMKRPDSRRTRSPERACSAAMSARIVI